jgi:CRISPR-associated protein Cmr2
MNKQYFHFTLGPVQSFVAQARRTRDFWAGSFLLSWLSAVAIKAVEAQEGELLFPKVEDDYLAWLENKGVKKAPQQGCIPNRFKGGFSAVVPTDFNAKQVVESVQAAWESLAEAVWEHDLSHCSQPTREIWDRQVKHFWEISWALTDDEKQSNLLDRRKNWRSYLPPEEPGVKCMMMDGWQELSGIETPNVKGLAQFWETLRKSKKSGSLESDLRPSEYLCAIAFIKRRFARVFHDLKAIPMPNDWKLHGWKVNPAVPSVSYMAAAPWLAKVLEVAPEKELAAFHDVAKVLTKNYYGEYDTRLDCIDKALFKRADLELVWDVKSLDGDVFFEAALDNKNRHPNQVQAQQVKKALFSLQSAVNKQLEAKKQLKLEHVSPFYAVLMMDGDSLGSQMSTPEKQTPISNALNHFTHGVINVVEKHSGFLIYAGGDDVLALLPLEFALQCAYGLRQLYLESFKLHGEGKVTSTLSGAIEYAHIKMPLSKVLGDAHHLLDDIAKDACGRDSIAVRVWKPGGQHLQWAMPWERAVENGEVIINRLAEDFRKTNVETPFSNSFFFNIAERFSMLQSEDDNHETQLAEGFDPDKIVQLIAAEYLNSGVNLKRQQKFTLATAKDHIKPLIEQCMPIKRIVKDDNEIFQPLNYLDIDAAHLIRFLVNKGVQ